MKRSKVQAVLALLVVAGFLVLCGWQVYRAGTVDADLKQALIISLATSLGYWLGSSDGSARKTEIAAEAGPPGTVG
jgi:hypothetical protein